MHYFKTKSPDASKLRKRKYKIIRRYGFEEAVLPGSLTQTYRRCGKPTCHCVTDEGHPQWVLSFSLNGKKHTRVIPEELAVELKPLLDRGRKQREALAELMKINAQLLGLWLREGREKKAGQRSHRKTKKST